MPEAGGWRVTRSASRLLFERPMGRWTFALLTGMALAVGSARADVTGSYAGTIRLGHPPEVTAAAAVLTDAVGALSGTLVLDAGDPALAGAYLVQGRTKGRRVRLRGFGPTGARIAFRGAVSSGLIAGKVKLRAGKTRGHGRLELTRLPGGGGNSSCDAVFVDNEAFFTTDVMGGVLVPVCAACHVAGGQAAAARLRVVPGDPAATASSTILVIDPAAPENSLLLAKPLVRLPHGGGQQLTEGGTQAQALATWATLVAQADCAGPPAPTTGPELYAANCAGCHGAGGAGLDGRPDVRCTVPDRLTDAVRHGRGGADTGMPAFSTTQLTSEQLALIVEYLDGLCSGTAADLYASNCATCHGATGGGARNADGVRGPDIRCQDSGDFGEKLAQGEEDMPPFPTLVGRATDLAQFVHQFCNGG